MREINGDFNAAFAAMKEQRADVAMIASDPMLLSQRADISSLASQHSVPMVYFDREFVAAGGLMSYGTGITWMYHQVGVYCGRILKGAKPSELPVVQRGAGVTLNLAYSNGRLSAIVSVERTSRNATRVFIKNMAMCRAWLALPLFVRLHASFQDVRLPTR